MDFVEGSPTDSFESLRSNSGGVFQRMGYYRLDIEGSWLMPVNFNYRRCENGNRCNPRRTNDHYEKVGLNHESAGKNVRFASLVTGELQSASTLFSIFGKEYLYLQGGQVTEEIPASESDRFTRLNAYWDSSERSAIASNLVESIQESLARQGIINASDIQLGVFGSHQMGLNGVDSDMDLVAMHSQQLRSQSIIALDAALNSLGFINSAESGRNLEHAQRYAARLGLGINAGLYLAERRRRYSLNNQLDLSIQILPDIPYPAWLEGLISAASGMWDATEIKSTCQVVNAAGAYNFPRFWEVKLGQETLPVISFSWFHQGMGTDDHFTVQPPLESCMLYGQRVETNSGNFILLQEQNHYLLPSRIESVKF